MVAGGGGGRRGGFCPSLSGDFAHFSVDSVTRPEVRVCDTQVGSGAPILAR